MIDEVYDVRVLRAASMEFPGPAHFRGAHWFDWIPTVITVVLIRNAQRTILVDTGVDLPDHYDEILRQGIGDRAGFDRDVPMDLGDILAGADVGLDDIDFVIPSHLHWDHAANLSAVPDAHVLFSRDSWRRVTRPREPEIIDPGSYPPHIFEEIRARLRAGHATLTAQGEVLPGIWIERVGGHSPCAQVIAVRTRSGIVLLPVDNIGFFEHYEARIPPSIMYHLGEWYDVIARVESEADVYVPSHDPAVFDRFPDGKVA
jgi:glyoxylase-like metal-dependent hydrolase (beta-lactamase superfamily II)